MEKKRRMRIVEAFVIVLVTAGIIFCIQSDNRRSKAELKDTYVMTVPSGERSSMTFMLYFNLERGTYSDEGQTADTDPIVFGSGAFSREEKDGATVITTKADSGETKKYLLDGKYLFVQEYFYKGTIPDTETFEAVCTYTEDSGLYHKLTFHEDGTYEEAAGSAADAEDESQLTVIYGSYWRDGKKIKRESDDGSRMSSFVIYNGKITDSYYTAD